MKGIKYEKIDFTVERNNGIIQTSDVVEAGVSKPLFYEYVKQKKLEQITRVKRIMEILSK